MAFQTLTKSTMVCMLAMSLADGVSGIDQVHGLHAGKCQLLLFTPSSLDLQGTMRIFDKDGKCINEVTGSGHHGKDYVGVASVRAGKGMAIGSMMETTVAKIV